MRYCYDDHDDALTIRLLTDEGISRTLEIDEDRHVYLDSLGHVVAIDILNASLGVKVDDLIDALDLHEVESSLRNVARQTFMSRSVAL
jgi:uncharacterized protein YuzE